MRLLVLIALQGTFLSSALDIRFEYSVVTRISQRLPCNYKWLWRNVKSLELKLHFLTVFFIYQHWYFIIFIDLAITKFFQNKIVVFNSLNRKLSGTNPYFLRHNLSERRWPLDISSKIWVSKWVRLIVKKY